MMATSLQPEIQNVLTVVDLDCVLDLFYIANHAFNVEYKPDKFNGLTMRLQKPKSCANIFTSGRLVCLGTKDEESARIATRKFARIIQKLGFPVKLKNYRITNIVASCDLQFRPNFQAFYNNNIKFVYYNPEIFPGLTYQNGTTTVVVFKSGKVILTNVKTRQQLYKTYEEFVGLISSIQHQQQV